MAIWQIILLSYIGAIVVWCIVNSIFLLISLILRKKVFIAVELVTMILTVILGTAAGIGDIALIIWMFNNGMVFWGIVFIILGVALVSTISGILALPFALITSGFSAWYDSIEDE